MNIYKKEDKVPGSKIIDLIFDLSIIGICVLALSLIKI